MAVTVAAGVRRRNRLGGLVTSTTRSRHDVRVLNPTRWLCTADPCGAPGNYVVGANVAAFTRVADAMLALGMV